MDKRSFAKHFYEKKPSGYWDQKQNQKRYLEDLAKKFNIKSLVDWNSVSIKELRKSGGHSLLERYGNSLFKALLSLYPEIKLENASLLLKRNPIIKSGHWKDSKNQRFFFKQLEKEFNIKSPKDWGKVTTRQFVSKKGGWSCLYYHGGSLLKALSFAFPEISWNSKWFINIPKISKNYFESYENQAYFLHKVAVQYNIKSREEWKRITLSLIRNLGGGVGLLKRYNNSLLNALLFLFPHLSKGEISNPILGSRPQYLVQIYLEQLLKDCHIVPNFKHPDLEMVELDLWIPKLKLAIEYHGIEFFSILIEKGNQHYQQSFRTFNDVSLSHQMKRDTKRRELCEQHGITLIEIPYWWDEQRESLIATLLQKKPDLISQIHPEYVISAQDPIPEFMKYKDSDFLAISKNWSGKGQTSGWIVSSIIKGKHALFDGEKFIGMEGSVMKEYTSVAHNLPHTLKLDGYFTKQGFIIFDSLMDKVGVEERLLYCTKMLIKE